MQLQAPAKINLSLQILACRRDGFHEIETVIAPISLYDEVTLTALDGPGEVQFRCDDPALPSGDDNLAVRAARLFLREANLQTGISIELQKRIPHRAGLAGGSSDAATVLLGMNRMFEIGLTTDLMAGLAAQLGSDIPFFIFQSAAICRGRGEIVQPLALSPSLPLLLLKPAFGVPTPWAYGRWKGARELPAIDYRPQSFADHKFHNDLERPVFEKHLFLAQAKMWLRAQAEVGAALMSGSGSTLFAVLRQNESANDLAARAKAELDPELWTCACATL